ncbi:MAG: sulfatase-like hydrolase/transferase [Planctomycetota bacterium]
MIRFTFLIMVVLCHLLWIGVGWADAKKPAQPNIVLVFIDDMGWGDFSCFGNSRTETENIDRLAREGIRFEQFYVNSPICSPSRVAISTGQYPTRWNITSYLASRKLNQARGCAQWLDPKAPMLARFLQNSGYATGHFGKWHMGGQRDVGDAPLITEYGFDQSLTNFEGLGPRILAMKDAYDGKPAVPHHLGSHKLGRPEEITYVDRSLVTESFTRAAIEFVMQAEQNKKPFYINVWPDDVHSPHFPPESKRGDQSKRQLYHGVLDTMDQQLGALFDFIADSKELRQNTLILVCSDNGPEPGAGSAGPFRGYKTHLYEGGIRSSLIVWGPGFIERYKAGTVDRASCFSAIDLVPSLLSIAGVDSENTPFDGENLASALLGKKSGSRIQPLFFRRPPDRNSFYGVQDCPDLAMRQKDWKVLCDYDGSNAELYHLVDDPGETLDLADQESEIVQQMITELVAWNRSMPQDNGEDYRKNRRQR